MAISLDRGKHKERKDTDDRSKDVLLVLQPGRSSESLVAQHRVKVNRVVITHPDQALQDFAVPLRISLVTARDEFDSRVD